MKTTTVPAQVTTVEDKIAGSLSLSQLMLLCAPIFLSAVGYILFPPMLKFTITKLVLFVLLAFVFCTLSIRLRGKLIIQWIVIMGRYNLRPRYYIYNKNDLHLRDFKPKVQAAIKKPVTAVAKKSHPKLPKLPIPQLLRLQEAVIDPRAKLSFKTSRKGGLSVHITEIK